MNYRLGQLYHKISLHVPGIGHMPTLVHSDYHRYMIIKPANLRYDLAAP